MFTKFRKRLNPFRRRKLARLRATRWLRDELDILRRARQADAEQEQAQRKEAAGRLWNKARQSPGSFLV